MEPAPSSDAVATRWEWFFRIAFGIALLLNLVAIWATRILPMGDTGGWIELIDVVHRFDSGDTLYSSFYVLPQGIEPNSLVVHLGSFLANWMPSDIAAKVLLSGYVVGTPFAMLALCRAFGRSRWLALFSAPMVFNALFNVGLLNYIIAFPLIFWAIALAKRYIDSRRWQDGLVLALVFVALFYGHVLAYLFALGLVALVLVLWADRPKDLMRAWVLAPAFVLFAIWVYHKYVNAEPTAAGLALADEKGLGLEWQTLDARFEQVHAWGMRLFRDNTDEVLLIVLGLSWMAIMAVAQKTASAAASGSWMQRLREYTVEIATGCCVLMYFVLPSNMNEIQIIAERVIMPIALLLALWPRLRFDTNLTRALLVPVALAAMVYPWLVHQKFQRFEDEYIGEMPEVIATLPDQTRLAYVLAEKEIALTYMGPLWHVAKMLQAVENGGITDDSFAIRPHCPVQFQPGRAPTPIGQRFWASSRLAQWDYVLLRSMKRPAEALATPKLRLMWSGSDYWLFEVVPLHDDETYVVTVGSGGSEVAWDCPDHTALTSLTVHYADRVEGVRAQCASGKRGPRFGGGKGDMKALTCPVGSVVVGLHGASGGMVDKLGIICAKQIDIDDATRALTRMDVLGGGGGKPFDLVCPVGSAAVGFKGRAGAGLDQAGLHCAAVSSSKQ